MNRLQVIRKKEKEYHDDCYENLELFKPGSWLHKPVKTVMELMANFESLDIVNVLDLGCGVGRNSIPIAEILKHKEGKVVCVDLLESAITNLEEYSEKYGVSAKISPVLSDISNYVIPNDYFHLIFSVSSLEHLDSEERFDYVIENMIRGTKTQGVNCIIISTGVREKIMDTGEIIEPMYELMFETTYLSKKFEKLYKNWKTLKHTVKPFEVEITRDGRRVLLESDVVTWVVQNT
ncbi:ubiquinone/menaquinone biosynthesis C-methylase UbiE [Fontibacillus solani]|uniref:Ubiquinone/menaquinone biosynthesis C-methylase UbiE n=1 Tax=Fontibacillus solani TaxID=1572857 RepID=A0A7W3XS43_9BACL|nr:class I SAM-dependent methyltransferase [Fontibacillus solani]MBA9086193.1 ubiquinone/menaquinone biosynthesis C-methylase UbiE [Fontibacillus solani]